MEEHKEADEHIASTEPLWTIPVFDVCLDHLPTPSGATVLSAESRCGHVPGRWAERLPDDTRLIALDPSRQLLDRARERVDASKHRRVFFMSQRVAALSYADGVFKGAACVHGLTTMTQAVEGLAELARVTDRGGKVVIAAPLASALPEVYDLFDEAFRINRLDDQLARFIAARQTFVDGAALEQAAAERGLRDVGTAQVEWRLAFERGGAMIRSALLRETFFPHWMGAISPPSRDPILRALARAIDTYFVDESFTTTMRAVVLWGQRA